MFRKYGKGLTWNAKCPIFLVNFTPKTRNYCLKNRALGFPGSNSFSWTLPSNRDLSGLVLRKILSVPVMSIRFLSVPSPKLTATDPPRTHPKGSADFSKNPNEKMEAQMEITTESQIPHKPLRYLIFNLDIPPFKFGPKNVYLLPVAPRHDSRHSFVQSYDRHQLGRPWKVVLRWSIWSDAPLKINMVHLKITCFLKETHLPNLHFGVPC